MAASFEKFALLLLISAVVAMLTRRLHLPYVMGLVVAGIGMAFVPFLPQVSLTKDLLFTALLPPLIFEAAFNLRWRDLHRELPVVAVLATLGVVISAAVTAAGMHYALSWPWAAAIVFGVLIAATDPVSVIATFKEAKAEGRLPLLIESESLLNDGTAAVLFSFALAYALGHAGTPWQMSAQLLLTVLGSLACGALIAGAALLLAGQTDDHLVEITFTTVAAYASFLLAEHFHLSGVLSTLTAGLIIGNIGRLGVISDRGRAAVQDFWEYAAFVANSFVFLLIGIHEATQNFFANLPLGAAAILMVTVGRVVAVYPCCAVFAKSRLRVKAYHSHLLVWGGLRGALALALSLALPEEMPFRESILVASVAVVTFSIFVQGLTLTPLLRRTGEI